MASSSLSENSTKPRTEIQLHHLERLQGRGFGHRRQPDLPATGFDFGKHSARGMQIPGGVLPGRDPDPHHLRRCPQR